MASAFGPNKAAGSIRASVGGLSLAKPTWQGLPYELKQAIVGHAAAPGDDAEAHEGTRTCKVWDGEDWKWLLTPPTIREALDGLSRADRVSRAVCLPLLFQASALEVSQIAALTPRAGRRARRL